MLLVLACDFPCTKTFWESGSTMPGPLAGLGFITPFSFLVASVSVQRDAGAGIMHLVCNKNAVTDRGCAEKQECTPCAARCQFPIQILRTALFALLP